jgi:hypothetical protein
MANAKATEFLSGKIYWAKVLRDPVPNYGGDAREWTFEFEPDEKGVATLEKHGLADRLKNKYEDRGAFLTLRKKEFNAQGEPNKPIRVYDSEDGEWDQSKLIGNGSAVDVKLDIRDYGVGKKKGVYPVAIRISDHVAYQSAEFGGMGKAEEEAEGAPARKPRKAATKATFDNNDDLNDDIPF